MGQRPITCKYLLILYLTLTVIRDAYGGATMEEARSKAMGLLSFPDAYYFQINNKKVEDLQMQLSTFFTTNLIPPEAIKPSSTYMFVALGAPKKVVLDSTNELPILVAMHYNGQREWAVRHQQNTWLLAVELNSGAVRVGNLGRSYNPGKRELTPEASRSGAPPDLINASGTSTGLKLIDLRKVITGDWRPGKIAVTVICYDLQSNTIVLDLQGKDGESKPPVPSGQTASLPPTKVVDFSFELQSATGPFTRFKMPLDVSQDYPLVPLGAVEQKSQLKATLLLLQLDNVPLQFDLNTLVSKKRVWQGAVKIDLRAIFNDSLPSGNYQVYLLSGTQVVGPSGLNL